MMVVVIFLTPSRQSAIYGPPVTHTNVRPRTFPRKIRTTTAEKRVKNVCVRATPSYCYSGVAVCLFSLLCLCVFFARCVCSLVVACVSDRRFLYLTKTFNSYNDIICISKSGW